MQGEQHGVSFSPDPSGWYIQAPATAAPTRAAARLALLPSLPGAQTLLEIHDFWKGRLAPLPGFSSRPGLITSKNPRPVKITTSPTQKPIPALLPPQRITRVSADGDTPSSKPDSVASPTSCGPGSIPTLPFQFDKHADIFIPQYLTQIQNQNHTLLPLPPIPIYPSATYLQTFLLPHLIEDGYKTHTLLAAPPPGVSPGLSAETYHAHWATLLGWELDNMAHEKDLIVLWKVKVKVNVWADAEFALSVPGIRENYPRLEIGDLVQMREVIELAQTGSGLAFEARVVALRKREGSVHLFCPSLRDHIQRCVPPPAFTADGFPVFTSDDILPMQFNISFIANAYPSLLMYNAVSTLADSLKDQVEHHNLARHWLFPNTEDLSKSLSVYSIDRNFSDNDWADSGLNAEQKFAASSIALHQSPVPYLISGPPGTGKTRTIAETVLQIIRLQPHSAVLLCAPSNPATDTLVLRLRPYLKPQEMLRLNNQNRTFAEVPVKMMQYCYVENDKFALPPWRELMKYRVVVCSCLDAGILVDARCTNASLMRLEDEVVSSIHPYRKKDPIAPHWTHLLIDEAAQGSEPELLVPISVVFIHLNPNDAKYTSPTFIPQLVLCGDSNQLGPIVTSEAARSAELDISLLERLLERPLYAGHAQARSRMRHTSSHLDATTFKPFTNLVKNYRSHPAILMPPSAMFYDDSLQPYAKNGKIAWSGLPNSRLPLIFIGHNYEDRSLDERATWFNDGEIDLTVATIVSLLSEASLSIPPLRPAEIGIMAPWREHVWKLRERLRKDNLGAVDVGTVEDYQGRESRVVIISCVRSSQRFLKEDSAKGLGLIFEKKRMNVAITRARELLIVIGSGSVLQQDPYWKGFIQFTIRNKLYVGPDLDLEMDGNYISRLESKIIQTSDQEEEDEGVAAAGGIAREVLRDDDRLGF